VRHSDFEKGEGIVRASTIFASLALAALAAPASASNIAGEYMAQGSCPAPNSAYRGTLTIEGSGLFHTLTWRIGAETFVGRAMEHDGRLVAEFRSAAGANGLMEMSRAGNGWRGTWSVYGTEVLCTETWTPR
jgi:hypothetical protein